MASFSPLPRVLVAALYAAGSPAKWYHSTVFLQNETFGHGAYLQDLNLANLVGEANAHDKENWLDVRNESTFADHLNQTARGAVALIKEQVAQGNPVF